MSLPRVCILLMDSFGIGQSLDASAYGDAGADTFGHIFDACANGLCDTPGVRQGPLNLPNLTRLGLHHAALASSGVKRVDLSTLPRPESYFGYAAEVSFGKDTPSGHWEIAGLPVMFDWGYFPLEPQCFPEELINEFIKRAKLPGIIGQKHASGTEIIKEFGDEHVKSLMPIVYTSADSVFQIAAHEEAFGLDRLYEICTLARDLCDKYNIGRVIARPFIGKSGTYTRTANRKDYSIPPPGETLLDKLKSSNREVIGIGKISDIFAAQGITQSIKGKNNMDLFDKTLDAFATAPPGSLVFTNFVDFDSSYGHRRDVSGYAHALENFDARLPELEKLLRDDDIIVITADHGCDPTFKGTDHTREHIPVLVFGQNLGNKFIGRRDSFADIGQSIAEHLKLPRLDYGISFF